MSQVSRVVTGNCTMEQKKLVDAGNDLAVEDYIISGHLPECAVGLTQHVAAFTRSRERVSCGQIIETVSCSCSGLSIKEL